MHALGALGHGVAAARLQRVDAPLSADTVSAAILHFERLYDGLYTLGGRFSKTRAAAIAAAPHGIPCEQLHADAGR